MKNMGAGGFDGGKVEGGVNYSGIGVGDSFLGLQIEGHQKHLAELLAVRGPFLSVAKWSLCTRANSAASRYDFGR